LERNVFPHLSNTARAVTFYLMALVMCAALALTMPNGEAAAVFAMVTPTVSVLLMQLVVTRDGWRRGGWAKLGMGRLGARVWGIAVGLPLAILLLSESIVRLTGLTAWHLPSGADTRLEVYNLPLLLIFCLFEEIGWRGYLGPLLAGDGRRAPRLRTGLLHGIWHLPVVFLATNSYLTEGNRWLIVPGFLVVITCAGQVYGWLREVSGSVYPAVLAHVAFNFGLGVAVLCVTTGNPDAVATLGREAGIVTLVLVAAAALWVATWRTEAAPATVPLPDRGVKAAL
jgi:CAAX protease family protein